MANKVSFYTLFWTPLIYPNFPFDHMGFSAVLGRYYNTGIFILQNAQPDFCTDTLARRNYRAELDKILLGTP